MIHFLINLSVLMVFSTICYFVGRAKCYHSAKIRESQLAMELHEIKERLKRYESTRQIGFLKKPDKRNYE